MRILLNRHSPSGCCRYPIKAQAGDEQAEGGGVTDLSKRLRDMAESIRLYEGGPSTEEATALEAALAIEHQDTDPAQAERAAILVHLSNMAANWNGAVGTAALEMAVRQIERGVHLPGGGE
mgnify:CR=1 FL=1